MDLNAKIEFKDIDFNKIKSFFKRKETIIAIFVLIFVVGIILVGNSLIGDYIAATEKRDNAKKKYAAIINSDTSVESLNKKIGDTEEETKKLEEKISEMSQREIAEILLKIEKESGLTWVSKTFSASKAVKDVNGLKAISVNISGFACTYNQLKDFLDYMDNFEREVTVDTLSFTKDRTTGRIKDGSMTITFYMKSESEAT